MLTNKQQLAIDHVIQNKSIFLTGPPGTGKSYTVEHIIENLNRINKRHVVTATTGCAAVNIGGVTLHSLFGLKAIDVDTDKHVKKLLQDHKRFLKNGEGRNIYGKIKNLDTLIIDEVSMMDNILCDNLSFIMQKIRENDLPFGGVQMILVGDFFQLPPVTNTFCFKSESWNKLNPIIVELDESIRHQKDKAFQIMLEKLRQGKINKQIYGILKLMKQNIFEEDGIKPTILYPNNVDVDTVNEKNMEKLIDNQNKPYMYRAIFSSCDIKNGYDVVLCKGAQIMVTRNISIEDKLVNGTRGVVIDLFDDYVTIKTDNGIHDITLFRQDIIYVDDNNKKKIAYVQFIPLKLAYAITIHKSQGATIDRIAIDIGNKIFAYGQAYTAISRARDLESIQIINLTSFQNHPFKVHPDVLEWYSNI